ncbi:MAG: hypothetical protein A3E37_02295 [Candidatus Andersenbacteria bacterium RIFCSPHIGHO2_12_FULL_46_9]|nr:MAG: hypothetical protein A3B76_06330 [Candidatus Andersenbacteria bacterium RIFCSPHIGHO2_02_FULL_46_16]OGY36371.1 MAG: hypothetical protein A3E37_02295 [Candidatus Andersenbacteria bacterium RIFCSPHIGHO2_12_FULL_46_9]OGY37864.1 MAG: hypothetical protein A3I08_01585 [Candidatus Andersenbacteria bacterium RIFCSPLOWO2_02_FULL_46_11]OGY42660.1 MAG: hypothetical protein A3G57_03425 [Candidatus Andersenbacteria bacterium RIFCSPLOWO2_12_FULL_45_8]HBE89778.1 hypothetical protein [Candidatus Anderse
MLNSQINLLLKTSIVAIFKLCTVALHFLLYVFHFLDSLFFILDSRVLWFVTDLLWFVEFVALCFVWTLKFVLLIYAFLDIGI